MTIFMASSREGFRLRAVWSSSTELLRVATLAAVGKFRRRAAFQSSRFDSTCSSHSRWRVVGCWNGVEWSEVERSGIPLVMAWEPLPYD